MASGPDYLLPTLRAIEEVSARPPEMYVDEGDQQLVDPPKKRPLNRGIIEDIGVGLKRGTMVEVPRMFGQMLKAPGREGDALYTLGSQIAGAAEERGKKRRYTTTGVMGEAASMLPPSLAAMVPAIIGGPVGVGASLATITGLFGGSEFQDAYEAVKESGGSDELARTTGLKNAGYEVLGETLGDFAGAKLITGAGRALFKPGTAQGVLDSFRKPEFIKPFAKAMGAQAAIQTGTEMGQAAGQTASLREAGVDTGQTPTEAAISTILPTLGMTGLLAPLGALGTSISNSKRRQVARIAADPNANEMDRIRAINSIGAEVAKVDPNRGAEWRITALEAANDNQPLSLNLPGDIQTGYDTAFRRGGEDYMQRQPQPEPLIPPSAEPAFAPYEKGAPLGHREAAPDEEAFWSKVPERAPAPEPPAAPMDPRLEKFGDILLTDNIKVQKGLGKKVAEALQQSDPVAALTKLQGPDIKTGRYEAIGKLIEWMKEQDVQAAAQTTTPQGTGPQPAPVQAATAPTGSDRQGTGTPGDGTPKQTPSTDEKRTAEVIPLPVANALLNTQETPNVQAEGQKAQVQETPTQEVKPNAAQEGQVTESREQQHKRAKGQRKAAAASGSDSVVPSTQGNAAPEVQVTPVDANAQVDAQGRTEGGEYDGSQRGQEREKYELEGTPEEGEWNKYHAPKGMKMPGGKQRTVGVAWADIPEAARRVWNTSKKDRNAFNAVRALADIYDQEAKATYNSAVGYAFVRRKFNKNAPYSDSTNREVLQSYVDAVKNAQSADTTKREIAETALSRSVNSAKELDALVGRAEQISKAEIERADRFREEQKAEQARNRESEVREAKRQFESDTGAAGIFNRLSHDDQLESLGKATTQEEKAEIEKFVAKITSAKPQKFNRNSAEVFLGLIDNYITGGGTRFERSKHGRERLKGKIKSIALKVIKHGAEKYEPVLQVDERSAQADAQHPDEYVAELNEGLTDKEKEKAARLLSTPSWSDTTARRLLSRMQSVADSFGAGVPKETIIKELGNKGRQLLDFMQAIARKALKLGMAIAVALNLHYIATTGKFDTAASPTSTVASQQYRAAKGSRRGTKSSQPATITPPVSTPPPLVTPQAAATAATQGTEKAGNVQQLVGAVNGTLSKAVSELDSVMGSSGPSNASHKIRVALLGLSSLNHIQHWLNRTIRQLKTEFPQEGVAFLLDKVGVGFERFFEAYGKKVATMQELHQESSELMREFQAWASANEKEFDSLASLATEASRLNIDPTKKQAGALYNRYQGLSESGKGWFNKLALYNKDRYMLHLAAIIRNILMMTELRGSVTVKPFIDKLDIQGLFEKFPVEKIGERVKFVEDTINGLEQAAVQHMNAVNGVLVSRLGSALSKEGVEMPKHPSPTFWQEQYRKWEDEEFEKARVNDPKLTRRKFTRDFKETRSGEGIFADMRMLSDAEALLEAVKEARDLLKEKSHAPYFHLGRTGEFMLSFNVADKEGAWDTVGKVVAGEKLDGKGGMERMWGPPHKNRRYVSMRFETQGQLDAAIAALGPLVSKGLVLKPTRDFSTGTEPGFEAGLLREKKWEINAADPKFLKTLIDKINRMEDVGTTARKDLVQAMYNLYLEELPETSPRKMNMPRSGIVGYDPRFMNTYAERQFAANLLVASYYSSPLFDNAFKELDSSINQLKLANATKAAAIAEEYNNELATRYANMLRPVVSPNLDAFKAFGHSWFLALSPAYLTINLMQPYHLTLPVLGAKFGFTNSAKALFGSWGTARTLMTLAVKEGLTKGTTLQSKIAGGASADIHSILKKAGLSEDHTKLIIYALRTGQLDFTQSGEIGRLAKGQSNVRSDTAKVLSAAGHYSEVINRIATLLASYDLAMQVPESQRAGKLNGHTPERFAVQVVRDTQLDYSDANVARFLGRHGALGKVTPLVVAFQHYNFQVLELVARLVVDAYKGNNKKEALKTLAGLFVTTGTLSGALGLPFATAAFTIANALGSMFGDDDEPVDAKAAFRRHLADVFGKDVAEIMARGAPRAFGFDISERAGLQNLMPFSRLLADRRKIADNLKDSGMQMLGPAAGATFGIANGMEAFADGRYSDFIQSALPTAIRSIAKAGMLAVYGYENKTGNDYPLSVTPLDVFFTGLGFTSSKKAEQSEVNLAFRTRDMILKRRIESLRQKVYAAFEEGDTARIADYMQALRALQSKNPEYGVDIGQGLTQRASQRAMAEASDIPVLAPSRHLPRLKESFSYANAR